MEVFSAHLYIKIWLASKEGFDNTIVYILPVTFVMV